MRRVLTLMVAILATGCGQPSDDGGTAQSAGKAPTVAKSSHPAGPATRPTPPGPSNSTSVVDPDPSAEPVPARPGRPQAQVSGTPEALPEVPRLAPNSKLTALNPEKTFFLETAADGKTRRVLMAAEVCIREGPLEVFLCKKMTKEHEAVARVNLDAKLIHAALIAAGAKPGHPVQFFNPQTEKPEFKPATGTKIKVEVHYRKDGKLHTHPAQEWIWNAKKKKPAEYDWVFAGSIEIKDPDRPEAPPYYGANSGEVISVSNFPYSMLDFPAEIGKDDANLFYEAKSDRIPPTLSKIWVILTPIPESR